MATKLTTAAASALADAFSALVDAGAGAGTLIIYSGTEPATANTALSGNTVLATLIFSDPAFPAASSGVATANAITADTSADATGTATFFRIQDSNSVVRAQGTVGTSGQQLNLNSVAITTGVQVSISSLTFTVPLSP